MINWVEYCLSVANARKSIPVYIGLIWDDKITGVAACTGLSKLFMSPKYATHYASFYTVELNYIIGKMSKSSISFAHTFQNFRNQILFYFRKCCSEHQLLTFDIFFDSLSDSLDA